MKTYLSTTFALLREHRACESGYKKLAKHLGGINAYRKDTPISLLLVLESNGVDDCLWCLQATQQPSEKIARLLACDFAESILPIFEKEFPDDSNPRVVINVARAYALSNAMPAQLAAAGAAWAAARDAAWSTAWSASWSTAEAAVGIEQKKQATIIKSYLKAN